MRRSIKVKYFLVSQTHQLIEKVNFRVVYYLDFGVVVINSLEQKQFHFFLMVISSKILSCIACSCDFQCLRRTGGTLMLYQSGNNY